MTLLVLDVEGMSGLGIPLLGAHPGPDFRRFIERLQDLTGSASTPRVGSVLNCPWHARLSGEFIRGAGVGLDTNQVRPKRCEQTSWKTASGVAPSPTLLGFAKGAAGGRHYY